MPKGFGKIEHKVYKKMPAPIKRFWDSYHTTVKQLLIGVVVAAIAVIGNEARKASDTASKVRGEVQVFKQNSPCTPNTNGEAERPKQCRESFSKAVQTLTPLQSCHILRKGATIILIAGKPIPSVTCIIPDRHQRESEKRGSQKGAESQNSSSEKSSSKTTESQTHQGGGQHGSKSPSDGGSGGNGPKGGSSQPDVPVGSPGGNEQGSGGTPSSEAEGTGSGISDEQPESNPGPSNAGSNGVGVEVLPEVGLPVGVEACVGNLVKVNCQ